jgi:hypothetical protein
VALYKKFSPEELDFMQAWYDPVCMIECLIPENFKSPETWAEPDCSLIKLRPYQFAMLDYSYLFADDDKLSKKQNFQNKVGAGFLINVAARNIGKSFCAFMDAVLTLLHGDSDESCVASFDFAHLKKVCTPISVFVNHHPLFELYRRKGKECVRYIGGGMEIDTLCGHVMYGRNENIGSPDPGTAFHSLHVKKLIYDEASYLSEAGRKKMVDAISTEGAIERFCGIPDLKLGSPLGKMLRDESKRNWICNMPQYVLESWDDKSKARAIEEYDGETSPNFRLNVLGEPTEGANSMFDMARIKENSYITKRRIKQMEVGKETFVNFEKILIVDKMPAEITILASDIGTTGSPSEVCIFFGDNKLLRWRYNISLFMLTIQEQAKIFRFLYNKLDNCIISLDCTAGEGRAIADELEILGVPKDRINRCLFNSKMIIGFQTNEDGSVQYDERGNPIHKLERTIDFANMQLEHCLYNGLLEIPHSEKFLREFSNYFSVMTGTTRRYGSSSSDHLLQSMQCCVIARFNYEFSNINKPSTQNQFIAGF